MTCPQSVNNCDQICNEKFCKLDCPSGGCTGATRRSSASKVGVATILVFVFILATSA